MSRYQRVMRVDGKPVKERPKWFDNKLADVGLRRRLLKLAMHLTKGEAQAQDLRSQATLKALERWFQHYEGNLLPSWVLRIMRNAHIDNIRRPGNLVLELGLEEWGNDEEYRVSNLGHILPSQLDNISLMEVFQRIAEMSAELRDALIAEAIEGKTIREIAEETRVDESEIKARLAQARGQLGEISDYVSENGSWS
jgi:RNA polymerase sigma-70 factor (ECF subfamily)